MKSGSRMKILLRKSFSFDESEHVVAARVVYGREIELVHILPIEGVARIVEVFSAKVGIQTVRERIMQRADVTSRASGCFKHCNVVPTPYQLICAGETGDSSTDDDDALF